MPLRPINAIFTHPKRRLYVVYCDGTLWQLSRMKIDHAAWQRRQPYTGAHSELYLSRQQVIPDPVLAEKLPTLDLPASLNGSTVEQFEAWWNLNGFSWLQEPSTNNQAPLIDPLLSLSTSTLIHEKTDITEGADTAVQSDRLLDNSVTHSTAPQTNTASAIESPPIATNETADIFADMLSELTAEIKKSEL